MHCGCRNKKHKTADDHLNCGICFPTLERGEFRKHCSDCRKWTLILAGGVTQCGSCGRMHYGDYLGNPSPLKKPQAHDWIPGKLPASAPATGRPQLSN